MSTSLEVPSRVRQLASELAQPQPMRRGSVSERAVKCGQAGGAGAEDPKARPGPYHSLTQAVSGKTRSRFWTTEQVSVAPQQVAAGREFRARIDAYWGACEHWAAARLELLTAASSKEAEKRGSAGTFQKTSPRKSKRS